MRTAPNSKLPPDSYPGLGWLARWRKGVSQLLQSYKGKKTPAFKGLQTRLAKLELEASTLRNKINTTCQHDMLDLAYSENGREDDYGSWVSGRDYEIRCTVCNKIVWEQHD